MPTTFMKFLCVGMAVSLAGLILAGCGETSSPKGEANTRPLVLGFLPPPPLKSGAQLWGENCNRCHIARSPDLYSAQEWEIIGHHMRLRCVLTGEEQREIVKFMQAAH